MKFCMLMRLKLRMKNMKFIILSLFLINIKFELCAQKGFKIIQKAEQKYLDGNYSKSMKLLDKADKMDYGFCGNAWMDAYKAIHFLRAQNYIKTKNYQLARNHLDSIQSQDNYDSIRIITYQLELGKDSLRKMIDASLEKAFISCIDYTCYANIPLTNGKTILKLKINLIQNRDIVSETDDRKKRELWLNKFLSSNNYKMIFE